MSEKAALTDSLPTPNVAPTRARFRRSLGRALFMTLATMSLVYLHTPSFTSESAISTAPKCSQLPALVPTVDGPSFTADPDGLREKVVNQLSSIVKIPSESFDDMGPVGEDARWDVFYKMHKHLEEAYPGIFETLTLEKVNTHGILLTWAGSNATLKPTLLMAHQDVVPVNPTTWNQWTHPPFSGHYDGEFVWGRGSIDCKSVLTAVMVAVDELVASGFKPQRTLLLSFGFDEEISGFEGAGHLSPFLEERYGTDGVAVIVDEGGGFANFFGRTFALPAVAEKGYIDVDIVVRVPGGHSSTPPVHNGIGILAELITLIEKNQYSPKLYSDNPFLSVLHCGNEHGTEFPSELSALLEHHVPGFPGPDPLALEAAQLIPSSRFLYTTTVATDIIQGGVKINALPERVQLSVNHRVNVGESVSVVQEKLTRLASAIADRHNLTVDAFTGTEEEIEGSIKLIAWPNTLEPAPVTPTETEGQTPYSILSGTTRAVYSEDVIVAPGIMTGNTDTRYYWAVSKHIFRFAPVMDGVGRDIMKMGVHTVNEHASVRAVVNGVKWYWTFIKNMDSAELV